MMLSAPSLLCIAHRGAMGHAPENTLLSIRTALELGAPCIEIDVHEVHGELLVIHDHYLDRTTNGKGLLNDHDLAYLRTVDAGQGERIPTLSEVCELIAGKACLNIEIKGASAAAVVNLVQQQTQAPNASWRADQFLISSFNHRILQQVLRLDPSMAVAALLYGLPADDALVGNQLGAISVNPALEYVDEQFVLDAHARGLQVFVYTVNEPVAIERMVALGVDGVFTNYPERVLAHYPQPPLNWGWRTRPI